jgi:tRNA (adenine57-N1/adenine58-N1)-methyltransferase
MVEKGERILLYGGERAQYLIFYEPGKRISTHLGEIKLPESLEYGDKVLSHTGKGFYILRPSTIDISMKVRRTTTIIYPKDAGLMILEAGIGAGSKVIEVGTGSGAFTIVLAKIVGDEGHVYSFERREEFLKNAKENIERAGLIQRVTLLKKDPSIEGFGLEEMDAAFIDVPEPWTLVNPTWEALKGGATWVSLSPNIEQVQKTYGALLNKFVALKCVEVLERRILVREGKTRPVERMVSHTGYLLFGRKVNIL